MDIFFIHSSVDEWIKKIWYIHSRVSLSHKKEWNNTICSNMDGPRDYPLLQEGGSLPGPETGLLFNTRKLIVQGDTRADKARDFIGKGHPGREQQVKRTQENCSVMWLAVSGFMVKGLVSRLSLANHSDSEAFLVVHTLFSQDGCQRGFWEVVRYGVSFWPFPNSSGWWRLISSVSCSLPGPPVLKQLIQIVTMVPGQGGWF